MTIITDMLAIAQLRQMAANLFGDMVKAVVDVGQEIIAVDAELHSDLAALLIQNGSNQRDLWGINIYPDLSGEEFIEFSSMINVRPAHNNRSRGVENAQIREDILRIVDRRIVR